MKTLLRTFTLLATFAMAHAAIAEEGAIRLTNIAMKQVITVDESGNTSVSYVQPDQVVPGDVILYTTEFENISDKVASDIVIDNPVPNNSIYRDGSAKGASTRIQFSLDGKNYDSAENLLVDRGGQKQIASAEDYTAIRWIVTEDLAPGEKRSVTFKTQIKKPWE